MNLQDEVGSQEYATEACLVAARQMADEGKPEQAERIYKQALRMAEGKGGENSALVGIVLIDLMQFYEKEGRHEEAKPLWGRIRRVMLAYLPEIMARQSTPK